MFKMFDIYCNGNGYNLSWGVLGMVSVIIVVGLVFEDICYDYDGVLLVWGLSLLIVLGEILCLFGYFGCGKIMLM